MDCSVANAATSVNKYRRIAVKAVEMSSPDMKVTRADLVKGAAPYLLFGGVAFVALRC